MGVSGYSLRLLQLVMVISMFISITRAALDPLDPLDPLGSGGLCNSSITHLFWKLFSGSRTRGQRGALAPGTTVGVEHTRTHNNDTQQQHTTTHDTEWVNQSWNRLKVHPDSAVACCGRLRVIFTSLSLKGHMIPLPAADRPRPCWTIGRILLAQVRLLEAKMSPFVRMKQCRQQDGEHRW